MWDLIVSVPDHCLSFYFSVKWSLGQSTRYRNYSKTLRFARIIR